MVVRIDRWPHVPARDCAVSGRDGAAGSKNYVRERRGSVLWSGFWQVSTSDAATGGSVHQRRVATPRTFVALIGAVSLAGGALAAPSSPPKTAKYVAPRAADGHADISGVWEHNAATPLERPDELAGRATLTDAEVKDLAQTASKLFDGNGDAAFGDAIYIAALHNVLGKQKGFTSRDAGTGDYNSFWIVGRWFENRTSLIQDPPTGKLPAQTAEAKARQAQGAAYRKD